MMRAAVLVSLPSWVLLFVLLWPKAEKNPEPRIVENTTVREKVVAVPQYIPVPQYVIVERKVYVKPRVGPPLKLHPGLK